MYLWIKALHVIAIIAWMAGLLYLPRLFVYHCKSERGSKQSETFKVMERRLLGVIMNPAMIVAWITGFTLIAIGQLFTASWMLAKVALALALTGIQAYLFLCMKDFAADRNSHSETFYRVLNEVPTLLMIGIVVLVIIKPF